MLVATGADYRRLEVEGCARFEGSGVFYAATPNEVQQCRGDNVAVVGGGNSAGQAAVFLAGPGEARLHHHPRQRHLQTDVDLPGAPHRADGQHRDSRRHVDRTDGRQRQPLSNRRRECPDRGAANDPACRALQLHRSRRREQSGCRKRSKPMPAASCEPALQSSICPTAFRAASRSCSRRAAAAFSPPATCAQAQ